MNHKNLVFQNWGCGNYTLVMNITNLQNTKCWQKHVEIVHLSIGSKKLSLTKSTWIMKIHYSVPDLYPWNPINNPRKWVAKYTFDALHCHVFPFSKATLDYCTSISMMWLFLSSFLFSSMIVSLACKKFSTPLFAKGTITPSVIWPILLYHTNLSRFSTPTWHCLTLVITPQMLNICFISICEPKTPKIYWTKNPTFGNLFWCSFHHNKKTSNLQ